MKGYRHYGGKEREPQVYGKGRVCESEGCRTLLSNYNPFPYCELHRGEWFSEENPYNDEGERQCLMCGKWYAPTHLHWVKDARSPDGLAPVCRYCRRYPERVKARLEKARAEA